jgi:squalene-hopene/tetraprenyl-beta-curcumene cyclase
MPRCLLAFLLPFLAGAADWNPRAAADYLDARQKEWFAWAPANANAKPCVSCHGGLTYLLARPALRRVPHESEPTVYETGLLASLRDRVAKPTPQDLYPTGTESHRIQGAGVESILAAFFIRTPEAVSRMWSLQTTEGGFPWFSLDLEPWEQSTSAYFGASLAALAVRDSKAPEAARLRDYLAFNFEHQPLHHQLMAIWSGAVPYAARQSALDDLWRHQAPDGSWTLDALGPWVHQPDAPPQKGPNAFATAFAAVSAEKANIKPDDPRLQRALTWLRTHQDPKGYWDALSMNKRRPPESIPAGFMRDAATAWAALALAGVE